MNQEIEKQLLPDFLTKQQREAITAMEGSLLISASAGSGKTFVLSSRVAYMLTCRKQPYRADRLLVVTFTKAAAGEMKARITHIFRNLLKQFPHDVNLQRQQLLLQHAKIMTIDSFCADLLREHFDKIGISPNFSIADENEMQRLFTAQMDALFEEAYGRETMNLQLLSDYFSLKGDAELRRVILKIYEYAQKQPFPREWLHRCLEKYFDEKAYFSVLFPYIEEVTAQCLTLYEESLTYSKEYESVYQHLKNYHTQSITYLNQMKSAASRQEWDSFMEALHKFLAIRRPSGKKPKDFDKQAADWMEEKYLMPAKKEIRELQKQYFFISLSNLRQDMQQQYPKIKQLIILTEQFMEKVQTAMLENEIIDFPTLEQLALSLLVLHKGDYTEKTELGEKLSAQLDEILVDEYQDVNPLQNMLFASLSTNGKNLFMVGDIKQSIYRFRQAAPDLFLEKYENYAMYDGKHFPARIRLAENFRSRREVTQSINQFFTRFMKPDLCGLSYGEEEALKNAAVFPKATDPFTELHLIEAGEDSAEEREAQYIVNRIVYMCRQKFQVTGDDGCLRDCRPGDFAILMRSAKSSSVKKFTEYFTKAGISVWTESSTGYFEAREISLILEFLQVIDNPLVDISLSAVLLSSLYAFTLEEIADLRLNMPDKPLYVCLLHANTAKADAFLRDLENFREAAALLSIEKLIQKIYDETLFLALLGAGEEGKQKIANLRSLLIYAKNYEKNTKRGLTGFLQYIHYLKEHRRDFKAANIYTENTEAVRILTIHKSKGLEFPIVFVADCTHHFYFEDAGATVCLNQKFGITVPHAISEEFTRYAALPYMAACLDERKEMLNEEMRILYVAMTRAKEKLCFTCCRKNILSLAESAVHLFSDSEVTLGTFMRSKNFGGWLMASLMDDGSLQKLKFAAEKGDLQAQESFEDIKIYYAASSLPLLMPETEEPMVTESVQKHSLKKLQEALEYTYPYPYAINIPAKLSVTQIVKEEEVMAKPLPTPKLSGHKQLNAMQRGNANHLFLQFVDFKAAREDLNAEISRLLKEEFLEPRQAEALEKEKLTAFLHSPLMERILQARKVERELSFLYQVDASRLFPEAQNEKILIQGIADCVLFEQDGMVIIDYKTDQLTSDSLIKKYQQQLHFYAEALNASLEIPVKESIIYSLYLQKAIILK